MTTSAPDGVPDPQSLPWDEIVLRKWLSPFFRGTAQQARENCTELSRHLLRNIDPINIGRALFRRNVRAARFDPYALLAWTARIANVGAETICPAKYRKRTIDTDYMKNLLSLSFLEHGPNLAREFLLRSGIVVVIEEHLPKSHVDGAVLLLIDGTPVIGLTLRHDRLDNFWFCLFHELAHIALHLDAEKDTWFIDDLDVAGSDSHEREADRWAQDHLISPERWQYIMNCTKPEEVIAAAREMYINPAIIAGRIRYERKNYKLFSHLIGQRQVRTNF
jgi:HTH-type transcriptional regulator/antitoxin HigA